MKTLKLVFSVMLSKRNKKMKYQGSKARLSKDLAPIFNKIIAENNIDVYCEPFVGGANMIQHIKAHTKIGLDNNKYLIAFFKAIQSNWNPLESVVMSRNLYALAKTNPNLYYLKLSPFVVFVLRTIQSGSAVTQGLLKQKSEQSEIIMMKLSEMC